MFDFIFVVMFFAILGVIAYGFYEWLEKIEVEKEYLQNLVKEQEKSKNTLRKKM
jgi:hypothetical protein